MAFPSGGDRYAPHLLIGDLYCRLDESVPEYAVAYRRWSRSLYPESAVIAGAAGTNLRPEVLRTEMTTFTGEGKKVMDRDDPDSAGRFYRSEGLDFRVPGQFSLLRSVVLQRPAHTGGSAGTTLEGAASFTDQVGTSSTSGTDRRLSLVNDVIELAADRAPGVGTVQVDVYAYHEDVQLTTTEGSSFTLKQGSGDVSGTDFAMLTAGTKAGTDTITGLTAGIPYTVDYYAKLSQSPADQPPTVRCQVLDVTDATGGRSGAGVDVVNGSVEVTVESTDSTKIRSNTFTPESDRSYQFVFFLTGTGARQTSTSTTYVLADKVSYGPALSTDNEITVTVRNTTGGSDVVAKTFALTSTAAGALIGSLTFASAAATNYDYYVKYVSGAQRPWLDKVVETIQTSGSNLRWDPDLLDLGQGNNIWLYGTNTAANVTSWTYDFTNEDWDNRVTIASTSGAKPIGADHTDAYQYVLLNDGVVYQHDTSTVNAYIAAPTALARGLCIAQNRLMVLGEDSTDGVYVYLYAVDATSYPTAVVNTVTVSGAKLSPDVTLRQRMTSSPTGGRFFLNYAGGHAIIYECDSSQATPTVRTVGELPEGVKATCIKYTSGVTFVVGQYMAETGETPRSGLWYFDQNGVRRSDGYFRRDNPNAAVPQFMWVHQEDLYILQGPYIWRRDLRTGGLFCEYELQPATAANQRALVVTQGHMFAAYDEGVWVMGSVGTYRQSSVDGGSSITSSIDDGGIPTVTKILRDIEVVTDDMATGAQVKVEYELDQDGTWVHAGTVTSGAYNILPISHGHTTVQYQTVQVRATAGSANGTATPVVKAVAWNALPVQDEEFLDVRLRIDDDDSSSHAPGAQLTGGQKAARLWGLKNAGKLVTIQDGYAYSAAGVYESYLAKIESIDDQRVKVGEGIMQVRLRLVA